MSKGCHAFDASGFMCLLRGGHEGPHDNDVRGEPFQDAKRYFDVPAGTLPQDAEKFYNLVSEGLRSIAQMIVQVCAWEDAEGEDKP